MAKANINLPNGTNITIDGSVEEVSKIVSLVKQTADIVDTKKRQRSKKRKTKQSTSEKSKIKHGLTSYVLELKKEDYFNKERSLKDIISALKERGYTYPTTSLSELMLRLLKRKEIRRIKKDKIWQYVNVNNLKGNQ